MNLCSHHRTIKSGKKLILVFNMEKIYTILYFHSQLLIYTFAPKKSTCLCSKSFTFTIWFIKKDNHKRVNTESNCTFGFIVFFNFTQEIAKIQYFFYTK